MSFYDSKAKPCSTRFRRLLDVILPKQVALVMAIPGDVVSEAPAEYSLVSAQCMTFPARLLSYLAYPAFSPERIRSVGPEFDSHRILMIALVS